MVASTMIESLMNEWCHCWGQVTQNERDILIQTLKAHNDNRTDTAKALDISRVGLYKKLEKYELLEKKIA